MHSYPYSVRFHTLLGVVSLSMCTVIQSVYGFGEQSNELYPISWSSLQLATLAAGISVESYISKCTLYWNMGLCVNSQTNQIMHDQHASKCCN